LLGSSDLRKDAGYSILNASAQRAPGPTSRHAKHGDQRGAQQDQRRYGPCRDDAMQKQEDECCRQCVRHDLKGFEHLCVPEREVPAIIARQQAR
jgi:hypothetical protein